MALEVGEVASPRWARVNTLVAKGENEGGEDGLRHLDIPTQRRGGIQADAHLTPAQRRPSADAVSWGRSRFYDPLP